MTESIQKKRRDVSLDIAKGILIFLVVWGHSIQFGFGYEYGESYGCFKDWIFRLVLFGVGLLGLELITLVIELIVMVINPAYFDEKSENSVRKNIIKSIVLKYQTLKIINITAIQKLSIKKATYNVAFNMVPLSWNLTTRKLSTSLLKIKDFQPLR